MLYNRLEKRHIPFRSHCHVSHSKKYENTSFITILFLSLTISCVSESSLSKGSETNTYQPPDQTGPWLVGTAEKETIGTAGITLTLQIWYPAKADTYAGVEKNKYSYDNLFKGNSFDGLLPDCSSTRPVVLFSHGSRSLRWQSPYLAEHLASKGYLVVAPDHTLNTIVDREEPLETTALRRPQDIMDSFDWLADHDENTIEGLVNCVDTDQGYAVVGHSYGGYTSLVLAGATLYFDEIQERCDSGFDVACGIVDLWPADILENDTQGLSLADDRLWAAVVLAPWDAEALGRGLQNVEVPVLVLGANGDTVTPMDQVVRPIYNQLPEEYRYLAEISNSGHASFIGLCQIAPSLEECGNTFRPVDEVNDFTQTATVTFFDIARGIEDAEQYWPTSFPGVEWQ